jgi:trans-aconitate methyltransferase
MQDYGPTHVHMRRIVRRLIRELDYRSVLEVGCGAGHNLPLLTEGRLIERVAGVDISEVAIARAARVLPQGEFAILDIESAHLDGQWDLIYSSLVLEHLPNDVDALRNMRAMTGKYLVATTIAGDYERYRRWDERVGHVRNYRRGELEQKLEDAGYRLRRSVYWGFPFYTPLARTLQNYSKAGTGEFSWTTRLIGAIFTALFYLNSEQRGDLLIVVAEVG